MNYVQTPQRSRRQGHHPRSTSLNFSNTLGSVGPSPGRLSLLLWRLSCALPHSPLHYVGWGDPNISPGQSVRARAEVATQTSSLLTCWILIAPLSLQLHYYRQVEQYMNLNSDLDIDDYYRFFPVPGMAHCKYDASSPLSLPFGADLWLHRHLVAVSVPMPSVPQIPALLFPLSHATQTTVPYSR